MTQGLMLNFDSPYGEYIITFEDSGKAAYAYLKRKGRILSAVWLYNRCPTPASSEEWSDPSNIPFANCAGYMSEAGRIQKNVGPGDVLINWESAEHGVAGYIYVFEDLYGVLDELDKVGYARFAVKESPLARVMEIESSP